MVASQQGLREDGSEGSMVELCRWFGVARRCVYYTPAKAPPTIRPVPLKLIKALIEEGPPCGNGTVAGLLGMSKNTVRRILQRKGWQVRKRRRNLPRIQALPSLATASDKRWEQICVASGAGATVGWRWRW